MNELIRLIPKRLHLVIAPRPLRRKLMTDLTARLAAIGPVRVLDGGNSFDGYGLARLLRQQAPDWQAALERTHVARAFTCHQMSTLLDETAALALPTLALEVLGTFYDENTPLYERQRLLEGCLENLQRLAKVTSVAVSAAPLKPGQPVEFLDHLLESAEQVLQFETLQPDPPPRLF